MSGSLPLLRPPISAVLRLWPNPPRLRSDVQSPDRSGIFDAAAPADCARSMRDPAPIANVSITAAAAAFERCRMPDLLVDRRYFAGAGAAAAGRGASYAVSSEPS